MYSKLKNISIMPTFNIKSLDSNQVQQLYTIFGKDIINSSVSLSTLNNAFNYKDFDLSDEFNVKRILESNLHIPNDVLENIYKKFNWGISELKTCIAPYYTNNKIAPSPFFNNLFDQHYTRFCIGTRCNRLTWDENIHIYSAYIYDLFGYEIIHPYWLINYKFKKMMCPELYAQIFEFLSAFATQTRDSKNMSFAFLAEPTHIDKTIGLVRTKINNIIEAFFMDVNRLIKSIKDDDSNATVDQFIIADYQQISDGYRLYVKRCQTDQIYTDIVLSYDDYTTIRDNMINYIKSKYNNKC